MGTRADFYVGRTSKAEYLGSVAMDGYPEGISDNILNATSEQEYRQAVKTFLDETSHATKPEQGWPWPWNDSNMSDYAYAWDEEVFHTTGYSPSRWWRFADGAEPDEEADDYEQIMSKLTATDFPNMEDVKNVSLGRRSGLVILGAPE